MFKLKRYLKNYKKESIISPLFKFLEACFELLIPLVVSSIVDVGIRNGDMSHVFKMCGLMAGFGVLGLACSLTAQYFAAKASMGFGAELRADLISHINRFSYTELDEAGTATLVGRITSDVNQAQSGVNLMLRLVLRAPFIVVGAVIMAFTINAKLAIIFVVLVVVLSVIIYGIMAVSLPLYKKVQERLDEILKLTREGLAGMRVVRAFSRQEDEKKEFEAESSQLMSSQLLVGKISALLNPASYVVINAAVIVVLWQGGKTVNAGGITQGELIALTNYMSQILLAMLVLPVLLISITRASASASRIHEVFTKESQMKEEKEIIHEQEERICVAFDQVDFGYKGNKNAINNIHFQAKKGQTIGIIGGTGSGKSTVVNLIPRFYDVGNGMVKVDGVDVREYPFKQLRSKIGMVPQNAVLFAGTIKENLQWGKEDASEEEMYHALDMAQAREFVDTRPEGLGAKILQGGKNLSGGQRQRLTIARALVKEPEILILDDSASALDFATDARLRQAIGTGLSETTVFIVSQRVSAIRHADRILVLDDARQAGFGTHHQLLTTCDVYREMCMSQLSEKELQQ